MCGSDKYAKYFGVAIVAGILFSLLFVPNIADKSGRKSVFVYSLLLSLIVQFFLLLNESSMITLCLLGLIGLTWPGKTLVGLMYILDF
jgi:Na+/melibiose symporter-like transporter